MCDPAKQVLSNATKGYDVKPKYSLYETRIKNTPSTESRNGHWEGERGESKFISDDIRVKTQLEKHNVNGVEYRNGMPDFSPFTVGEVKIEITSNRKFNFKESDEKLAQIWSQRDNKVWTSKDIENWRKVNVYTWHELNDMETMQLIPSIINTPIFKHFGGVGEAIIGGF